LIARRPDKAYWGNKPLGYFQSDFSEQLERRKFLRGILRQVCLPILPGYEQPKDTRFNDAGELFAETSRFPATLVGESGTVHEIKAIQYETTNRDYWIDGDGNLHFYDDYYDPDDDDE
jgi:hypothetical protein